MDFEKICMLFTMQEPYYGIILSSMERIPSRKFDTAAVSQSGNVFKLYYNPDWVSKLDIDTTLEVLKHEVLHLAFHHFSLFGDQHPSSDVRQLQNIAADMEVNGYLNTQKMKDISPVLATKWGWNNYLGAREYFKRLMALSEQMQQQKQNAQAPQQPCNGGVGTASQPQQKQSQSDGEPQDQYSDSERQDNGQQDTEPDAVQEIPSDEGTSRHQEDVPQELLDQLESFDDHSLWPDCESEDEREQLQSVIDDLLVFAAEEVEKGQGSIPGELKSRIAELRKRKPRPVADWKRYFRRYLGNEFTEFIRKSKKRESRRFPDAAGNRHRRKSHILVGIDTSGSVSMPEYLEFFGQLRTLTASATFRVLECDTKIQHEYEFTGKPNDTLHGGGGTLFEPVVDYFNKNRKTYDALVYFTDGYATIPKDTPKDMLWVISSKGDQSDRKKYQVNGASVVFIKPTQ